MSSQHDRWLANYRRYDTEVYCATRACPEYGKALKVTYEEEYGQGWTTPEECSECGAQFSFDAPPEKEDDDEDES